MAKKRVSVTISIITFDTLQKLSAKYGKSMSELLEKGFWYGYEELKAELEGNKPTRDLIKEKLDDFEKKVKHETFRGTGVWEVMW